MKWERGRTQRGEVDNYFIQAPGVLGLWTIGKRTWLKPDEWRYILAHGSERIGDYATSDEAKGIAAKQEQKDEREHQRQQQAIDSAGDAAVVQGNG